MLIFHVGNVKIPEMSTLVGLIERPLHLVFRAVLRLLKV